MSRNTDDIIIFDEHMGGAAYSIDPILLRSNLFFMSDQDEILVRKKSFMEVIEENKIPLLIMLPIVTIFIVTLASGNKRMYR